MNWEKLLSAKRWGSEDKYNADPAEARSEFQRDYDRLIFSSPFRRLQNKTQVFPLPGSVFVHNRLTHSLEVASVGKSLGRIFYNQLKKDDPGIDDKLPLISEIGNIVSAACLAHDLGNPAFGHSGEAAISHYFTNDAGLQYRDKVTESQWADLTHFEGNANAFRILTHPYAGKGYGSFALTYSTLAAIAKYPCESIAGHNKSKIYTKKYGFFQSEQTGFQKIAADLELDMVTESPLVYKRHPLVYLVEAADDICYNIIDLEDAHRLKILSYGEVETLLLRLCNDPKMPARLTEIEDEDAKISLLRAKSISTLIFQCSELFYNEQETILNGDFNSGLIDAIPEPYRSVMKDISKISVNKIYNYASVVQIEVAGYKVMGGLLEEFVPAYLNNNSHYSRKLVDLIPKQFITSKTDEYAKIQTVLDFVSGMTDLYAVELFRKIKGISFPSLS
ncbi:deoxyguanosinetriphosphate triphosphohydrolase [Dyadobacter fanqingshengii]|uniref:Deoxyguanosinetriphosphate triphosphohydrolase n=1 Tax=Dyadobacter fanqingshengii TaxID=2906443 RepID=A0A9X1PBG0_9BACT|nr:deoxyguanosinetriphosphate triphosphohydrolase [Dyadobacter fanqingshengii]MCF0042099.1 deoxyguanosinetriphosphate triphosphohydrolase [Dyadobacter fanqingshengii]MCF2506287.1 deoxyguanosinetriphosphate triphosphohydrolase [Dyadobacter fanqingshengii]USJ35365.1 deoxyguanosinetriphosphate triphosphohydrolase [Dyadobacter fanqingshengii]